MSAKMTLLPNGQPRLLPSSALIKQLLQVFILLMITQLMTQTGTLEFSGNTVPARKSLQIQLHSSTVLC